MENCLLMKLKGAVSNDNLPTLNTIILGCKDASSKQIVVGASSEAVYVTFTADVHEDSISGNIIAATTKVTIAANHRKSFFTKIGQSDSANFVKIENIYNLESLISSCLVVDKTIKNGLASLAYDQSLVQFGGIMSEVGVTNAKKLYIAPSAASIFSIDSLGAQYIQMYDPLNTSSLNSAPEGVQKIKARWNEDVANLPSTMRCLISNSGLTRGELADFVAKARIAGRTSGFLLISHTSDGRYERQITLNGVSMEGDPNITVVTGTDGVPYAVLEWTSGSIGWGTEFPEGAEQYTAIDSFFFWQPYE